MESTKGESSCATGKDCKPIHFTESKQKSNSKARNLDTNFINKDANERSSRNVFFLKITWNGKVAVCLISTF